MPFVFFQQVLNTAQAISQKALQRTEKLRSANTLIQEQARRIVDEVHGARQVH